MVSRKDEPRILRGSTNIVFGKAKGKLFPIGGLSRKGMATLKFLEKERKKKRRNQKWMKSKK